MDADLGLKEPMLSALASVCGQNGVDGNLPNAERGSNGSDIGSGCTTAARNCSASDIDATLLAYEQAIDSERSWQAAQHSIEDAYEQAIASERRMSTVLKYSVSDIDAMLPAHEQAICRARSWQATHHRAGDAYEQAITSDMGEQAAGSMQNCSRARSKVVEARKR